MNQITSEKPDTSDAESHTWAEKPHVFGHTKKVLSEHGDYETTLIHVDNPGVDMRTEYGSEIDQATDKAPEYVSTTITRRDLHGNTVYRHTTSDLKLAKQLGKFVEKAAQSESEQK